MEILFRGQKEDGSWVYGGVVRHGDAYFIIKQDQQGTLHKVHVKTKTVQQYTNVKDSLSNKIFLGDKIRIVEKNSEPKHEWIGYVDFLGGVFAVLTEKNITDGGYVDTLAFFKGMCDIYIFN